MEAGRGTYAAPLRMLAAEAFERLSVSLGEGQVGLVTGEERINDDADVICCTAEMAPMRGELLVLDEVHWANDSERGWAWTRLLLGAEYRHIRVAGAPDALPLIRAAFPAVEVVLHERLCPLEIATKSLPLSEVPERAAVVAFSRKAVYHVAGLLQQAGRRPAVLYGAMPPAVRRHEVARFVAGDADVVVATDVIGHGINLPVSAVLFAETQKFDGVSRRELAAWEVAQIAGRAGRFGFERAGTAAALTGVAGMSASPKTVARAAMPKVDVGDGIVGYRSVSHGRVAPSLEDLAATTATQLPLRLRAWSEEAVALARRVGWVKVASVEDLRARLAVVARSAGLDGLDLDAAWQLARSPLDAANPVDSDLLARMAHAVAGNAPLRSLIAARPAGDLNTLEVAGRRAAALRWFTLALPAIGDITHDEVVAYEAAVTQEIITRLGKAVKAGIARCTSCKRICAPWSKWCDSCYRRGRWSYDDWDDDRGDDGRDNRTGRHPQMTDGQAHTSRAKGRARGTALAASGDPLARPKGAPRKLWRNQALPALLAVTGEERRDLRGAMVRALERWTPTVGGLDDFAERARALLAERPRLDGRPGPDVGAEMTSHTETSASIVSDPRKSSGSRA